MPDLRFVVFAARRKPPPNELESCRPSRRPLPLQKLRSIP